MRHLLLAWILVLPVFASPSPAQGPSQEELEIRAQALATRRAERDAARAERMPSRPIVLRGPIPLPIEPNRPLGGLPAGKSCPAEETCDVAYAVPTGKILVVSGLWSATAVRCDQAALGSTPGSGQVVAPWWHCSQSLAFSGKGAGFTGYLFDPPSTE
jgi:hypothetical protein